MPFKVFFLTFFLSLFSALCSWLNAQTSLVWYGTTDTVSALSVAGAIPAAAVQDAAGNIYAVGILDNQVASPLPSQVDFDFGTGVQALNTITNNTNNDIFIAKYTAGGQLVWLKGIQGTANDNAWDIALDINGNLLISGGYANFSGTPVDFDPGTGTAPMVPPILGWSAFVLKLDNNGNFVWVKAFNTTTTSGVNTFQSRRIKTDAQGNVYTAGEFLVPVDFDPNAGTAVLTPVSNGTSTSNAVDIFIQKMDASGNFVWVNSIVSDTTLRVLDLEIDPSGNPILAGIFQNQMDLDNTTATNLVNTQTAQQRDIFLIKYASSTGIPIWTKTIGGTVNMDASLAVSSNLTKIGSLLTDAVGNIFLTSCFVNSSGGTIDFDPSPTVYGVSSPTNAGSTPYVAKFSATGALLWVELYAVGGNARGGYGLALDNLGNIYMSGSLTANTGARFRTETGTSSYYTLTTNGSGLQAFTCKLNPLGRTIWVKSINSQNAGNVFSQVSATTDVFIHNNQIYNLGFVFATAAMGVQDFDPSAAISGRHTNSRNQMFIAKWCDMPGFIIQPGAGVDSTICAYEETNLSISPILGAGSYFWSVPAGWSGNSITNSIVTSPSAGALANSVVSVSVFTACGQTDAQTFPFTVVAKPSVPIVLNTTACERDSLILTVRNPPATATVNWFDSQPFTSTVYRGERFASLQPVGGYNYYVSYMDSGCASDYAIVQGQVITAPPAPVVSQSFSTVCEGNPLVLEMQPIAGASYLWREVSGAYRTGQILSIQESALTDAGTYESWIIQNGCTSTMASTAVSINPAPAWVSTISNNSPLCEQATLTLTAPTIAGVDYDWVGVNNFSSRGETVIIPNVSENLHQGVFSVVATDQSTGCVSLPLSTLAQINGLPTGLSAQSNSPICAGATLQLQTVQVSGATYTWTGANGFSATGSSPSLSNTNALATGLYAVTVDVSGCIGTASTLVSVQANTTPSVSGDTTIEEGQTAQLNAYGSGGFAWSPATYLSNPNVANPVFAGASVGVYVLTVSIGAGDCISQKTTTVTVNPAAPLPAPPVFIPNLFTPNGDGYNDTWSLESLQSLSGFSLVVFSRAGQEVFRTDSALSRWDGKMNGQTLPTGAYWYLIQTNTQTYKGAVTIQP